MPGRLEFDHLHFSGLSKNMDWHRKLSNAFTAHCEPVADPKFQVSGVPPTGGGGAGGHVTNVIAKNVQLDRVNSPVHLYQTNGGHSYDSYHLSSLRPHLIRSL